MPPHFTVIRKRLAQDAFWPNVLQRASDVLSRGRTIVFNLLLLLICLSLIAISWKDARVINVTVEPIHVPETLAKRGLTAEVVRGRISDRLREIEQKTETKAQLDKRIPTLESTLDIQIPGASISSQSLVKYVKQLIGRNDIVVTGEIVEWDNDLDLRINIKSSEGPDRGFTLHRSRQQVYDLIAHGADEVMLRVNPYILAAHEMTLAETDCKNRRTCDYSKAVKLLTAIIESRDPKYTKWAYVALSTTYLRNSYYKAAEEAARKAIAIDPGFAEAHYNLGVIFSNTQRNEEALEKYRISAELKPDAWTYQAWGQALGSLRRYPEAIEKYRMAAKLDPRYAPTLLKWAYTLNDIGKYDEALEKIAKAIELDPEDSYAYAMYSYALVALGRGQEAIDNCRKANELNSDDAWTYIVWGDALAALNRTEEAAEKYRKANEKYEKYDKEDNIMSLDRADYNNWSYVLSKLEKKEEAQQKALKADQIEQYSQSFNDAGAAYAPK